MLLFTTTGSGESVFVTETSAEAVSVSISVALLLPGTVSVTPEPAVTVAVFDKLPVADAWTVACTVYVTVAPDGRLNVSLMLPLAGPAVLPVAPPAARLVYDTPVRVAGNVSATVVPGASLGPALVTTIVYVSDVPGVAVAEPSVLVICRSAFGVSGSRSVALLFPVLLSVTAAAAVTVAVLLRLPVADDLTVADTV